MPCGGNPDDGGELGRYRTQRAAIARHQTSKSPHILRDRCAKPSCTCEDDGQVSCICTLDSPSRPQARHETHVHLDCNVWQATPEPSAPGGGCNSAHAAERYRGEGAWARWEWRYWQVVPEQEGCPITSPSYRSAEPLRRPEGPPEPWCGAWAIIMARAPTLSQCAPRSQKPNAL